MGVLSSNLKPSFLGLLKFLNSMNWFIVFFSLINISVCIYEDQIGKFDWHQTYVGRIKFAQFDTVSTAKKIIVATEENVLAALHLKTGQVVWRHVFETASAGNIQLLHVADKVTTTVTGTNPYLVRGWDSATGILQWEWSLTLQDDNKAEYSEWFVHQGVLVHLLPDFGTHLEVTMYNLVTGANRGATSKFPAVWSNEGCILSGPYYTCISGGTGSQQLLSIDVTSNAVKLIVKPLADILKSNDVGGDLRPLDGNSPSPGFVIDDKKIIFIKENDFETLKVDLVDNTASATFVESVNGPILIQLWSNREKSFSLIAHSVETGNVISEIQCSDPNLNIPEPEIITAMCTKSAREQHACRILVNGLDDALHLLQQGGRVLWTREEALANVVTEEFVDLPVSDTDAALESEFGQKEGSVWSSFTRRLHTQYQQLLSLVKSFQGEVEIRDTPTQLVRDYFNLHKIIVLVTAVGKVFGMDNLSGEILWHRYEPGINMETAVLFTRRSTLHPPHDAYITIVAKDEETGHGVVWSLRPESGAAAGAGLQRLSARVLQAAALAAHSPALVLLDEHENVQVFPESAAPYVNMYLYVVEKDTAKVQGYALFYNGKAAAAVRTWAAVAGGAGARVAALAARGAGEAARAPGRALPDRSVLYTYANPNLVLLVLDRPDPVHKDVVIGVALDVVSGAIIAASTHRRARALPLAVLADNSLAYFYRNDKHRRVEIATMELFEGKERWGEEGSGFSSWDETRAPSVERQTHVLAATPTAAAFTVTRRALTERHLLLALSTGWVSEMAWPTPGVAGELAPAAGAALSYNQSLPRARRLAAAPAGLESTSLLLVSGLDLFFTRVTPSKTFDLLKDDFDYYLITLVLGALIVATYSTKYFASRKMLKLAWK